VTGKMTSTRRIKSEESGSARNRGGAVG
jgi:hypothetical protein